MYDQAIKRGLNVNISSRRSECWTTSNVLKFILFTLLITNVCSSKIPISRTEEGRLNGIMVGRRSERITEHLISDCMTVTSEKGHYYYKASGEVYDEESTTCGVYLMADPNEVLVIHFDYIDLPCEGNNLVSFVDGWELNGSYFPNDEDYNKLGKYRFHEYCDRKRVKEVLESSQNAALIRYRVSQRGKGFSFYVTTRKNPTPCNILVDSATNVYTLRNYGQPSNCSLMAMNPAKIQILSLTVGINSYEKNKYRETGTYHNCDRNGLTDYVQVGGGTDLGQYSIIADSICGIDSIPGSIMDAVFCGVTRVRLVSSGSTNNLITLSIDKVKAEDYIKSGVFCPGVQN